MIGGRGFRIVEQPRASCRSFRAKAPSATKHACPPAHWNAGWADATGTRRAHVMGAARSHATRAARSYATRAVRSYATRAVRSYATRAGPRARELRRPRAPPEPAGAAVEAA
jgi:hypothetical protein